MIRLFVDRPVLSLMCAVAILAIGWLALTKLPLQLMPSGVSDDSVNIWIPIQRDMPPREVEEQVLRPLEEQLRTIPGVKQIDAEAGSSRVFFRVQLEKGLDPVLSSAEVRDRAQRARLEWPAEVDQYFAWREDMSAAPLAFCQIRTPERDPQWDFKIDQIIRPRLEAVEGVGRAEIWGLVDETLRVLFDRDKLVEHRIDYGALLRRLSQDNFAQPVGELDNGYERYLVRVDSKFRTREEIERYPIRTGLTIGDVARVEDVPSVRDNLSKVDGLYTYTAVLRLQSGTNPMAASRNVKAATAELERDPELAGIGFAFLFDQGAMIEESLQTLLETALQGGLLALVALFLFLRNVRLTLIVALAIPLALMIAAGYLFFAGETMNIVSMAGLTLAVGMVVDNSVVVLENIRRRRAEGADLDAACVGGTREMVLPVTMATLTTVVVILPLIFMGSDQNVRVTLAALGMPLSIALLGSLVVALLLLPAATRRVGTGSQRPSAKFGFLARVRPIEWMTAANRMVLRPALGGLLGRSTISLLCLAVCASIVVPNSQLQVAGGGAGIFRRGDVTMNLEMPRGMDLADVAAEVERYEAHLEQLEEELDIESVAVRFGRTSARFDISLDDAVPASEHAAIGRRIEAGWPQRPGVRLTLQDRGAGMGGGAAQAEADAKNFVLRIWGPDSDHLMAKALEVRDRLVRRPEVERAEVGGADATEEVVVAVDRELLNERGVRPEALERTMASGLRGMELTRFEEEGREVRLIAQFDSAVELPSLYDLKETQIWSGDGTFQRLDDISEIRFERSLDEINRIDGKTHVTVVGQRAEGFGPRDVAAALRTVMQSTTLPRGYSWSEESQSNEVQEQLAELVDAGGLSLTLVFLLMAILFESLVLPAAILATVPFALLGAFWSLFAFHGSMDVMAGIGMLLLCGIVVNNGIVLLDCIERLRREGVERAQAIREGCRIRLRPIFMTAMTTIVGLLPMALFGESTGESISYVSMSIAVAGGLTISTLSTPIAVPLVYLFLDDLTNWSRGLLKKGAWHHFSVTVTR